jgi:hypothetical protein
MPKFQIWYILEWKVWCILRPFGVFCSYLAYASSIWHNFGRLVHLFSFTVNFTDENLATLRLIFSVSYQEKGKLLLSPIFAFCQAKLWSAAATLPKFILSRRE